MTPRASTFPAATDGRARGSENLEYYLLVEGAPPTRLCLDLSRLNRSLRVRGPKVEVCINAYVKLSPPTVASRLP